MPTAKQNLENRLAHALLGFPENQAQVLPDPEPEEENRLTPWQTKALEAWSQDCYTFLTAKDEDEFPILWTKDERDRQNPIKHFPEGKPYLAEVIKALHHEKYILADKSRQMMLTYSSVLYANWDCTFNDGRLWLLSKNNDEEADQILEDKVRFPFRSLPDWVKGEIPQTDKPADIIRYPKTGSKFIAVGQNIHRAEARGSTPSGVIIDEAAFQDEFEKIWASVLPNAGKIIGVTTPNIGHPGARFFYELLERE